MIARRASGCWPRTPTNCTRTQYALLDFVRAVPRYEVVGGPGSGKTYLALEQARRWAEGGARVAFVCYSHGLAAWANRWLTDQPEPASPRIQAMTYHSLGSRWGEPVPDDAGPSYWEDVLPARMLDLAQGLPADERFDALVVDEAQDFADSWWPPLLAGLSDPAALRIAVFGDTASRSSTAPDGRASTSCHSGSAAICATPARSRP